MIQKELKARSVVTVEPRIAQALGDPVRSRILTLIRHKPLTAEEIAKVLSNNGHKKAVTTIRHHLDTLKKAGLIEASRMVEVRGALLKYYSPTVLNFDHEPIQGLDHHTKLVHDTEQKILKILKTIYSDKKFISDFDKPDKPCPMCKLNHYREFAALEILNHSIAMAMQSKEFVELVPENKDPRPTVAKA